MRTWIWLPVAAALALAGGGALAARPLAKSVMQSQAKARGLELEVKDFEFGWFSARLKDSTVRLEGVDAVSVHLDEVGVELGLTAPRIRRIEVLGGQVRVQGSVDDVRDQISAFRARHQRAQDTPASASSPGSSRTDIIRDLDVVWENAFGAGQKQQIRGFAAERSPEGQRFGADLVSLVQGPVQLEVAGATVRAAPGGLDLTRINLARAAEARVSYHAKEAAPKAAQGDDDAPPAAGQPPAAIPSPPPQQGGLAHALHTDPNRIIRVRTAFELVKHTLLPRLPPEIEVERLWMSYRRGNEKLSVGPNRLLAKNDKEGLTISLRPRETAQGTPLSLVFHLPQSQENGLARFELEGGPVALSTLGIKEGAFGLLGVPHTSLQGTIDVSLDPSATHLSARGQFTAEGLRMDSPKLSPEVVTFPKLFVSGKANVAVDGSFYEVSGAELALGDARMQGDFALKREEDSVTLHANLNAPLVSCQALLDSAPRGLLGPVADIKFDGTFSLKAGVEADSRNLSKMKVRWDFENGCHAKAVPRTLDPDQFRGAFRREVMGSGMLPMEVEFGPHSLGWTPFEEVSPYVETAILVSEDGRFYRHDGFDDRAIESAIAQNTKAGRFVRGASTISMQLAKNLYLHRQKTLSRKLQEAALTSLLEQSFDKKELLELYMNIVEFGPGVYGIRQAATHYFNTTPAKLTPAQAFFLVSILPAPTIDYFEDDGTLGASRWSYVTHLLEVAHKRGRLTESELKSALEEKLLLGQPETRPSTERGAAPHEDEPSNALAGTADDDSLEHFGIPSPAALRPRKQELGPEADSPKGPGKAPQKAEPDPEERSRTKVDPRRRGIHL